jgi:hypothetical protein
MVESAMKYIIRACEERELWVKEMISKIPSAEVVWDNNRNAMDTFLRALDVVGDDDAVHLEDDAILCAEFTEKSARSIANASGSPVQFFSMRSADQTAGGRWEPGSRFSATVAFYLPPGSSRAVLEYASSWPRLEEHPTGFDLMVADWMKTHRLRYWIEVPNLADHRFGRSLINPSRSRYRRSLTFEQTNRKGQLCLLKEN